MILANSQLQKTDITTKKAYIGSEYQFETVDVAVYVSHSRGSPMLIKRDIIEKAGKSSYERVTLTVSIR